jgi:competence protein ComEC
MNEKLQTMKTKIILILIIADLLFGVFVLRNISNANKVKTSFLDVGQGDAILIRQGNANFIVDGGPDKTILRRLGETIYPWEKRIDVIFLTHPDLDHLWGLIEVLKKYEVGQVVMPQLNKEGKDYKMFLDEISKKNIPVVFAKPGIFIKYRDVNFSVLAPNQKLLAWSKSNLNVGSMVLRVSLPGYALLLSGDMEMPEEQYLLNNIPELLRADIIKVAHHGSKTASGASFLDAVKPALAIFSVGEKNRYGHPNPETLKRFEGISYFRTDENGTITLVSKNGSKQISLICSKKCDIKKNEKK